MDDENPVTTGTDDHQWVIIDLMGRTRTAGRLTHDTIGLRLDIPETPGQPATTHWYGPTSWHAIHAVDETTARTCAAAWRPEPVHPWELPAPTPAAAIRGGTDEFDNPWGGGGPEPDRDDEDEERTHG